MRPPEPIGAQHQLEGFDCGNAALNRWLQQRALANERQGVSRTVVLCPDEGNPDRRQSPAGARDRRAGGCVPPLAQVSPLAAQCLDVDAAALRTSRLTPPKFPTPPIPWPTPTESFVALLHRLDRSIAKAWEQETPIDDVNG